MSEEFDLVKIWPKAPFLRDRALLIAGVCVKHLNPVLWERLREGKVVLLSCPENDSLVYGKIASVIRSASPKSVTVVTVDGSPHCFLLQAAVNEAEYIVGEKLEKEHYVLVNGEELVRVDPDSVRVARYLSIVKKIVNEEALRELEERSLECRKARELRGRAK